MAFQINFANNAVRYDTLGYDTIRQINVRPKADEMTSLI